ncbi:hypothetical protein, partial [Mesorhizobium escarrei]|uniref:hypothetical protein n=1 Tax=Mesorhizobium escarrei TaxID=666018 RepID=UPI0020A78F92
METTDLAVPIPPTRDVAVIDEPQAIDADHLAASATRWVVTPDSIETFGLIAKKETDALYLEEAFAQTR